MPNILYLITLLVQEVAKFIGT